MSEHAARISPLVAMQCAKWPRPTTKVRLQISATEPVMEWLPLTSHATMAMIQPPTTPLQKMCLADRLAASAPNCVMVARDLGLKGLGASAQERKEKRAGDVGREDDHPETQGAEDVAALSENECDGIERVLRKKLACGPGSRP